MMSYPQGESSAAQHERLRARFKAIRKREGGTPENWRIRVHRALSWLKRAQAFDEDQPEGKLLFLWIALNSLYGRWDGRKSFPDTDGPSRIDFIETVCEFGPDSIGDILHRHRGLVKKILSDPFLSALFWRDPRDAKLKEKTKEDARRLNDHLRDGKYAHILTRALDRVSTLRGQIVHGASTGGSKLNRDQVRYCLRMLEIAVPVILEIVIEKGCDDPWPPLCYPPSY